ncbi:MAG: VWA domain-containing protein, partial [Spirochaetales bacterium]|nr:VWA domain-containing protein [Spirochaetales bacterium]
LISDGAFDADSIKAQLDLPLTWVPIGNMTNNLGITAIQSRKDPVHPDTHHIFINVQNYTNLEVETELTLYINGDEYSRTKLLLPERGSVSPVQSVEGVAGRLEAEISSNDPFPLDDKAYMLLNPENPVSVLLITDGNFYLESLLSITEGISLVVLNEQPPVLDYDIVVFDKPPIRISESGNYIFLGSVPVNFNIRTRGTVNFPGIKNWDPSHPLMANVDPRTFSVYQAVATEAGDEFTSILDGEVPLIYVHKESGFKTVYFTFRLEASDLFIRPAFPVLLINSVKWLAPEITPGIFLSEQTGRLILQRDTTGRSLSDEMTGVLINSEGETSRLIVQDGVCSFFPEKTGFYNLTVFGRNYEYAVNLASPVESDIAGRFDVSSISNRNANQETENVFPLRQLILLLVLALMIYELMLTRKKREGSGEMGKLQLSAAFLSIISLIIVLSGVSPVKDKITTTVVFLLDISRSISEEYRNSAFDWINSSLPETGENINTGLVVFGETASVVRTPGPSPLDIKSISFPVSEVSNLEAGLQQSLALMPSSGDRRIVILSDGNETRGNILESIRSYGINGVRVSTVPLSGLSADNEIIARSITGPSRASPEEKISLTLEIESQIGTTGNLFFFLDGEYYGEDIIAISRGRTLVSYKVNLKNPGYHLFEAVIESEDDTHFENNQFQKMIFIEGSPPVLYVHDGRGSSELFLGPLQDHGFTFDIISASTFPDTLSELFSYDSVILDNIPAYFFSISKMEMLRKAVAGGLGLLVIGGDNSLGAGGYYNTPLEKAIPIDVDITSSLDLPGTALVMVIDNSGSMQDAAGENERKSDLAKQAVYSALEVLEPGDTAGILAFDSGYKWIVRIEPELDLDSVRANLFPLSPGGGTILLPALKEAYRVLDSTIASVKHILILSDGYTDAEGFKSLVGAIHKSGITVSTVAVGSTSNKKLMENIAAWGR